ncbi:MAG: hypothetical protein FWD73_13720 [Polyangiaceae bacterium]|nr:hypothetical protein [Polyangiaceae bacterium]
MVSAVAISSMFDKTIEGASEESSILIGRTEISSVEGRPVSLALSPELETSPSLVAQRVAEPRKSVVRIPVPSEQPYHFELRQQWEGVVTHVDNDEITVVLRDLTHPERPDLEAVVSMDEVAHDDLALVQPGAVLYWSIGYETTTTGERKRVSHIRFRRLPAWSRRAIARVNARIAELTELFGE